MEKYSDFLWFRVEISYSLENEMGIYNPLSEQGIFYTWRSPSEACTSVLIRLLFDKADKLIPGDSKIADIAVIPSDLSKSYRIGEKLFWGGLQNALGYLTIKENLPYENQDMDNVTP